MADRDPAACESCKAAIIFALIANNAGRKPRWMPLNPAPDPAGNVAARREASGTLTGRVLAKDQKPAGGETLYMPHFATCTDSAAHRRRQRGQWTATLARHHAAQRRHRTRPPQPGYLPGMGRIPKDTR